MDSNPYRWSPSRPSWPSLLALYSPTSIRLQMLRNLCQGCVCSGRSSWRSRRKISCRRSFVVRRSRTTTSSTSSLFPVPGVRCTSWGSRRRCRRFARGRWTSSSTADCCRTGRRRAGELTLRCRRHRSHFGSVALDVEKTLLGAGRCNHNSRWQH